MGAILDFSIEMGVKHGAGISHEHFYKQVADKGPRRE